MSVTENEAVKARMARAAAVRQGLIRDIAAGEHPACAHDDDIAHAHYATYRHGSGIYCTHGHCVAVVGTALVEGDPMLDVSAAFTRALHADPGDLNAALWAALEAHKVIVERATAERLGKDAVAALTYQNHRDRVHVADLKAAVEAARAEEREIITRGSHPPIDWPAVIASWVQLHPFPIRWRVGVPAPEPCPFARCGQGPFGRDELNAHLAECPEAKVMQDRINDLIRRVGEIAEHGAILEERT